MTHYEFDVFLVGTIIMCCIMSIFNAFKNGNKGWPGLILSVSFLVFAVTIYFYKTGGSQISVKVGVAVLLMLLTLDFVLRSRKPPARKKR